MMSGAHIHASAAQDWVSRCMLEGACPPLAEGQFLDRGLPICSHRQSPEADWEVWPVQARLLVPDSNVGAIMGKKGEALAELRKSSGATIRVHDSHETPSCGRSTDRVVTVRQPGCGAWDCAFTTTPQQAWK